MKSTRSLLIGTVMLTFLSLIFTSPAQSAPMQEQKQGATDFRPADAGICYSYCNTACETLKDTPQEYKICLLTCMHQCKNECDGNRMPIIQSMRPPGDGGTDGGHGGDTGCKKLPKGTCDKAKRMCPDPSRGGLWCDLDARCNSCTP